MFNWLQEFLSSEAEYFRTMSWRQDLKQHNPFMICFRLVSKTSYEFTGVSCLSPRVTDCCAISQDMLVFISTVV